MSNGETKQSIIGEDIEIVGSIKCASSIQIDGKLNGDLSCNGTAVIGNKAIIKGNISVESVTIMGQISGNVTARDRIEMKSTTRLNGDIRAKRLTVEDGVTFVGKSEVNPSGTAGARAQQGDARSEHPEAKSPDKSDDDDSSNDKDKGGFFGKKS